MLNALEFLYTGPHQLVPVASALAVWIALGGIGYLVAGRGRITEASPFLGWGVASIIFTLIGVASAGYFSLIAGMLAAMATAGLLLAWRRGDSVFVPGSWRVVVLALPVLVIAGAMPPSQWDEFSHWLPAARFLVEHGGFPPADGSFTGFAGYPFGWPLLSYLGSKLAGGFLDNLGSQFNMLMLLTFGVFVLRMAFCIAGRPRGETISWPFAAGAVLVVTAFNPTFAQKIVFTAYSDVSSSVATGVALLVGYVLSERLAGRTRGSAMSAAWQLALVTCVLINVRQTNLVVFAAVIFAVLVVVFRDQAIVIRRAAPAIGLAVIPALALYLAWRWHIAAGSVAGSSAEATFAPLTDWHFDLIPEILIAMGIVALKKSAFFVPMAVAVALAPRAVARLQTPMDRIVLLTSIVFAANVMFLFITYLGHFGEVQAVTAVSFWRYNMDIGMVAVIFLTVSVLWMWHKRPSFDHYPRAIGPIAVFLVLALPFAFITKLRFDLEPPKPHYTHVAKDLISDTAALGSVYVLDPLGTGEAAVILRHYLQRTGGGWLSAFQNPTPDIVAGYLNSIRPGDHVLIHSLADGVATGIGSELDSGYSYLFRRDPQAWSFVKRWKKPANHPYGGK